MKKLLTLFLFFTCCFIARAQDAKELQETGRGYMRQGDFANAALVLTRALQQEPDNVEIIKDIALNYYLQKDYTKALEAIKPATDRSNADDQCFQIAGNIYKAMGQPKECEKIYKKGLKKFPQSGAIYNEYGELLWATQDLSAIKQWEKGIEMDPSYSGNYYNATKYYYITSDKVWTIIYGEIFVNIESLTGRTAEIKNLLLDTYKKLYGDADLFLNTKNKNSFEQAFLQTLYKQNSLAATGINPETLTMIRTRFILDWFNTFATKFPFKLFDYQLQLLREGMFDAYNQWLFGTVQNLVAYQNWTSSHAVEYDEFSKFQKGRLFKMPAKQSYHKVNSK
jgi:tetratricopeptide (TPR) repeat protein